MLFDDSSKLYSTLSPFTNGLLGLGAAVAGVWCAVPGVCTGVGECLKIGISTVIGFVFFIGVSY